MTNENTVKLATRELNLKQQRFVDCFDGNIKEAANKAGLSYEYARQMVTKGHIFEAIWNRQNTEARPNTIAARQERQAFWTGIMRDKKAMMRDRLKASELLGKSEADFSENTILKNADNDDIMAYISPAAKLDALVRKINGEKSFNELPPSEKIRALLQQEQERERERSEKEG